MKTSPWMRWLIAAIALFALVLFAACGDDDDDDEGGDSGSDATETPDNDTDENTDDKDDEDSGSGGGSDDEEEYAARVCTSISDFGDALVAIGTNPDNADATEEEQLELLQPPFEDLIDALDDADPPGDVEDFHEELLETFRDMLERMEDGDTTVFDDDPSQNIPEPSAEVQEKYNQIARGIPECEATGIFGQGQP